MMNLKCFSFILLFFYSFGHSQIIDSFNYDFLQINQSEKLKLVMSKLNTILKFSEQNNINNTDRQFSIVHFGDSHIQADYFSGAIRKILQSHFGEAGNGIIFPYSLCKSYGPKGLESTATGKWNASNILMSKENNNIGIAGYALKTFDTISKLKFQFNNKFSPASSETLKIWYSLDSSTTNFDLNDEFENVNNTQFESGWGIKTFKSRNIISGFDVSISQKVESPSGFSFLGFELDQPLKRGIKYNQCGVVGAQFSHLINNAKLVIPQLKYLAPDLIIFSFGTNEAYDKNIDSTKYFNELNKFFSQLNLILPNTAIIITTAPDTRSQGRIPPNQININNQLIKISKTHDLSYFDLNRAMGGWGSLNDWHKNNLVSNDKLHFNASGYALQGKMFSLAFLENYNDNFKNDTIEIFNLKNEILNNLKSILIPKKNNIEEITNPLNIKPTSIKSPKIYVVKRGDTIYRIAQKFHVSGKKILLINNLKENSIIRPGQKIKLP